MTDKINAQAQQANLHV